MPEPSPIQSLCYLCLADSTPIEMQGLELRINCLKCNRPYCEKHASILDSTNCNACLNDFQVTKQDFICAGVETSHQLDHKGRVITNEKGEPIIVRRPYQTKSKQIILFGSDWLFAELKMSEMSEEQCEVSLEWHRAHVSYLEQCITQHRITKAHKLAQVRIPHAVKTEKKAKEKKEKSLEMLAQSLKSMSPSDLASLMQRLQESLAAGVKK
jgi:hypothetical protein